MIRFLIGPALVGAAYVTGSITRYFGVQGGYRALSADYLLDSDTGDLEMKGFYFGGVVRFSPLVGGSLCMFGG